MSYVGHDIFIFGPTTIRIPLAGPLNSCGCRNQAIDGGEEQ